MVKKLLVSEKRKLALALEDEPMLVIPRHQLLCDLANAYASADEEAIVVQHKTDPGEPLAIGGDPEAIWKVLRSLKGWRCINVAEAVARPLSEILAREFSCNIRFYQDLYFLLERPVIPHFEDSVRLLNDEDLSLVNEFGFVCAGHRSTAKALQEEALCGGIRDDKLVNVAYITAVTAHYFDVGVETQEAYRKQGLAAAAAAKVIEHWQSTSKMATWSTGEDNYASMRVAEKLGFQPCGQRVYLICLPA